MATLMTKLRLYVDTGQVLDQGFEGIFSWNIVPRYLNGY